MESLKEVPREVRVVIGEFGAKGFQAFTMVGYDVLSGDSWNTFPPKLGSIPYLVGEPPVQGSDYRYTCEVEWETNDGSKHRGTIQVTPVLMAPPYRVDMFVDHE